jgi:hypothetical protein
MSLPQDAAQMARDGGIETPKLAPNAFTTDKIFQIGQGEFIGRDNLQSGNGNVNATQSYPDISLTSALSAPFNATTAWRSLSAYINQVDNTNLYNTGISTAQTFGSFPGTAAFCGGVVAPNGYVYLVPAFVSKYFKINPNDNSVTSFGTTPWNGVQLGSFHGGVLAPNGKIYFIPAATSMCYGIDPSNDTVFSFGTFTGNVIANNTSLYIEGCVGPNGKIYCFPSRSSLCQVIDPTNNTVQSIGTFVQSANGNGGTLAPNGLIYMNADYNNVIKVIDPSNNTVTAVITVAASLGSVAAFNGTVAPNGKIYCSGVSTYGLIIDPSNNTVTSFGTFQYNQTDARYGGRSVLLPNGLIYVFGMSYTTFAHLIDPSNNTVTSIYVPGSAATHSYHGGVQALNGKLFYVPHAATNSVVVSFVNNNYFNQNYILSPFAKP